MNSIDYYIDFATCHQSKPCFHKVTKKVPQEQSISSLMMAPEIVDLIVSNKLKVSYINFMHFSDYFVNNEHFKYAEVLRSEFLLKGNHIEVCNDAHILRDLCHGVPLITYSKKIFRRSHEHYLTLYGCDKISKNEFRLELGKFAENNDISLHLTTIRISLLDPKKENLSIKMSTRGHDFWFFTDCMKNDRIEFYSPFLLDEDVTFESTGDEIDNIYCYIHHEHLRNKNMNIIMSSHELVCETSELEKEIKLDQDKFYSEFYLVLDDECYLVREFLVNGQKVLYNIKTEILEKYKNTYYVPISRETDLSGTIVQKIKYKISSKNETNRSNQNKIKIYAKTLTHVIYDDSDIKMSM